MKDYSGFLTEKPYSCSEEGCSMKFANEDQLMVHKKRHEMSLNLGFGQKGTTFSDQTPTPTQFIRNCEEVGLFQDLQNVNPFEETFQKAMEAIKSGQLSLEKSFQTSPPDDTLHTPKVFLHVTDIQNSNQSEVSDKSELIPCENEQSKQDACDSVKSGLGDTTPTQNNTKPVLGQGKEKGENAVPLMNVNISKSNALAENKVMLNVPEGHLLQLLTPEEAISSCNMVFFKNSISDSFSSLNVAVKEKLKKNINEKKIGKNFPHKVPIMKCPIKKVSNLNGNKFLKFSKNAKKLISKLEMSDKGNEITSPRQKKINKVQSKESRSEFLARSRAASSRCREKKKMYLLYLEKVNSELSTANQNLLLINSLLRQEINDLRRELLKHRNCNAADKNTEAALITSAETNLMRENSFPPDKKPEVSPSSLPTTDIIQNVVVPKIELIQSDDLISENSPPCQFDPSFSIDVAEVILNSEPEEGEIPLSEQNKPSDIIVRFNSVSNEFPATIPTGPCIDRYIEKADENVKQIYREHSYYLKKPTVDINRHLVNYESFRNRVETQIASEKCENLKSLKIKIQQNESLRDLTSLNSKVLLGPRTPPPLILLKPFKKRTIQGKRNEKTS